MLTKLKDIFPSMIESTLGSRVNTDDFLWFTETESKIVGIPKLDITTKERQLLETFLTPYNSFQPPVTEREQQWTNVLFHGGDSRHIEKSISSYRFVFFSLSDDSIDPIEFREAIHGLFSVHVPILWENSHEGVFIEENPPDKEGFISYKEIIDVLMSDFYMNVHLYVSSFLTDVAVAANQFQWGKQCFYTVYPYSKQSVINYVDAVPFLILDQLNDNSVRNIVDSILLDTVNEDDLLHSIQTFIECNSNTTLAAKKLYMHRNSLQYRVDKFIEKTGVDVKQFHGAISIYLALMLKQQKNRNM